MVPIGKCMAAAAARPIDRAAMAAAAAAAAAADTAGGRADSRSWAECGRSLWLLSPWPCRQCGGRTRASTPGWRSCPPAAAGGGARQRLCWVRHLQRATSQRSLSQHLSLRRQSPQRPRPGAARAAKTLGRRPRTITSSQRLGRRHSHSNVRIHPTPYALRLLDEAHCPSPLQQKPHTRNTPHTRNIHTQTHAHTRTRTYQMELIVASVPLLMAPLPNRGARVAA